MSELTAALATIEKFREITGCPAGVDLQDWVKRLAAENAAIKAMNDCLSEELRGYESDGAFEGPKSRRCIYCGGRLKPPLPTCLLHPFLWRATSES